MKNLKISLAVQQTFPNLSNYDFVASGKSVANTDSKAVNRYFFVFRENTLYLLTSNDGILSECNIKHLFPEKVSPIKGMWYVDIFDVLYTFHETGEVISFTDCCSSTIKSSFFTDTNEQIKEFQLSPDHEIGAYINGDNKLKLLLNSSSFYEASEYDLNDTTQGEQMLINVGWGKKETQFHGSEGKKAALNKFESNLDETFYGKSVHITWRGDSAMFAVSYYCDNSKKRRVKIFSKDGSFLCLNEDIAGLDGPISWKPQGSLISFSQQLSNKYVIAFMEKNGLKHLDFEIPDGFTVKDICWNADSNILCSLAQCTGTAKFYVMLWVSGNYHWYLKQMFPLNISSGEQQKLPKIIWDEDCESKLYIFTDDGSFLDVEFIWTTDHRSDSNKYYVSVIDNDNILTTPFHSAIIPPPMCEWSLKCPYSVNKILFPPNLGSGLSEYFMCAVLSDGRICLFKQEKSEEPKLFGVHESLNEELGFDITMSNLVWISDDSLVCLSPFIGNHSDLFTVGIVADKFIIRDTKTVDYKVIAIVPYNGNALMYLQDGSCIEYNLEQSCICRVMKALPEPCYDIVAHSDNIYGLSEWSRLYKNDTAIAYNVTSFLLHSPFLLATTSNHTLLIMKTDGAKVEEVTVRKLERGSRLVAVTGNTVVMQMPRGNLEAIQPRALTILDVGKLIDKKLYKEAVHSLRKQRISLDLCIDHDPAKFFENIDHFVKAVDPQWITLLISELSEVDVTKSTYSAFYNQKEREHIQSLDQKIERVCQALLDALQRATDNDYMLPTLSCLVKTNNIAKAIEIADHDQAVQHLLFLVDVETLYNEALGAYNLDAALKFAGKSSMDPKEFIPYLNNLRQMEENFMKFEIDKMLKKYPSALEHLSKCGDDKLDMMYSLIEEFRLYGLALKLSEQSSERYNKIALMYGEYLFKTSHFEEAGVMFLRSQILPRAIAAFTKSGNWRKCILLSKRCNYCDQDMEDLSVSLSSVLVASRKFNEAAIMYKDGFSDATKAMDMYLLGHLWSEAIFLAEISGNKEFEESKIRNKVLEASEALLEEIITTKTNILHHSSRLKQVRLEKLNKPKFRDFDEMSETGSMSSRSNQSNSSRTSRMTRKMSRKLWSLKEGNQREEEALLAVLFQTIANYEKITDEVKNISITLLHLQLDEDAKKIQDNMKELIKITKQERTNIWPKDPNEDEIVALDAKFKYPPEVNLDSKWELEMCR